MTDLTLSITRFDIFDRPATEDNDEFTAVRFFNKRKLIGEIDQAEVVRYEDDFDSEDFNQWLKAAERTVGEAMDYLGEEASDEEDEERDGGSVVPTKYRILYGSDQNCGDEMALALTEYVTMGRANKKNPDGGLDRSKLREVAEANGISENLQKWEDRGLNGGLLRMNVSNILRGMIRRGLEVRVGSQVWQARPEAAEENKAKRKAKGKAD